MKHFDGGLAQADPGAVYLGIDQSLTGFGLCILAHAGPYEAWTYQSKYSGVTRLGDIREWIRDRITDAIESGHEVLGAAMESGVVMSASSMVLGELAAAVKLCLYDDLRLCENARYPLQVPPTSLKKYATGKGNASKHEVVLAAYKQWGVEFTDDNAADAYCLARLASGHWSSAAQRDALRRIQDNERLRDPAYVGIYA